MESSRARMVERDLVSRNISDECVLRAMSCVDRHYFVSEEHRDQAYLDCALPISHHQTISQPYVVALMTQYLDVKCGEKVLEIGTGSGYQAAVLAELGAHVTSIEKVPFHAEKARKRLSNSGYSVEVLIGDGSVGWLGNSPYDAIAVAASGPYVPEILVSQLRVGGCLVMPVGGRRTMQNLVRVVRSPSTQDDSHEALLPVSFVPLLGADAWPS